MCLTGVRDDAGQSFIDLCRIEWLHIMDVHGWNSCACIASHPRITSFLLSAGQRQLAVIDYLSILDYKYDGLDVIDVAGRVLCQQHEIGEFTPVDRAQTIRHSKEHGAVVSRNSQRIQ